MVEIYVLGVGQTKFGELWSESLTDLLATSQLAAIDDAKIAPCDIDAIFTGTMCASLFCNQSNVGSLSSEILGVSCPSTVVEGACASGGLALRAGVMAILSGQAETVLVNGVEKMTDTNLYDVTSGLASAAHPWEQNQGVTFPALNALITRMYMEKYGLTREELAMVSVKNHENGFTNPYAHLRKKITVEDVINAPMVADPLTLLDCSPVSDGAASIILSSKTNFSKSNIKLISSGQANDVLLLSEREDLLSWKSTKEAGAMAYKMAGVSPGDIDIVELHDGFSITQILALQDLYLSNKKLTINPSGGLKSRGHPVGATGVVQAVEIVKNLNTNQVGLTHNVGGCGAVCAVHIFKRGEK
jgi:acetyl-CoA C-acetyltransferase